MTRAKRAADPVEPAPPGTLFPKDREVQSLDGTPIRYTVRGRRAPIVGSVCMDMSMIDVTGMDVAPGDEVVIVGHQQDEVMGMREMAATIGTIPYELLCRVGSRIQRVYQ